MKDKEWLVAIEFNSWIELRSGESKIFAYEEVIASSEYRARYEALKQFEKRVRHEPVLRRRFEQRGLNINSYCAPVAVEIN